MSGFSLSDMLPRHTKGYLWIGFLVAVFLIMAMSENGVFSTDSDVRYPISTAKLTRLPRPSQTSVPKVGKVQESEKILSDSSSIPKFTTEKEDVSEPSSNLISGGLDPKDVVILVKTGATSIWRRMPAHMSTTLGNPKLTPNVLYYSDTEDNINGNPVIDVLANVSSTLKASPDFVLYNRAKEIKNDNLYLESGSMEGDFYLPGGWRLDKYKFLPMVQHAANTLPGKKWYIYMEDDNYFFWESLYAWLATLDHTSPLMIGSPAFRLGEDFAHGGSGFAISGKAMALSFGSETGLADRWENYAAEQCCGDQVLSHVLHEKGVARYRELDGGSWAALQALPTWRIGFGQWNWCSPIMNIHKVHQADISKLYVFEKEFKAKTKGAGRIRYKDIFEGLAASNINSASKSEWDNYASAKSFSSSSDPDVNANSPSGSKLSASQLAAKPWYSRDACEKACNDWDQCLSWKYADDNCSIDHTAAMGQRIDAGIRMESGWMLERIEKLARTKCEALAF